MTQEPLGSILSLVQWLHCVSKIADLLLLHHHEWFLLLMHLLRLTNLLRTFLLLELVTEACVLFLTHLLDSVFTRFAEGFEHVTEHEPVRVSCSIRVEFIRVIFTRL